MDKEPVETPPISTGPKPERLIVWDGITIGIGLFVTAVALLFGFIFTNLPINDWAMIRALLTGVGTVIGVGFLVSGASRRVAADAKGITWRNAKGKQFVPWEGICDFYAVAPVASTGRTEAIVRYEVVTQDGTTLGFTSDWAKSAELRQWVAGRAVNATVALLPDGSRGWEVKGARPADLPCAFRYDGTNLRQQEARAARHTFLKLGILLSFIAGVIGLVGPLILYMLARPRPSAIPLVVIIGIEIAFLFGVGGAWLRQWGCGRRARREMQERVKRGERFEATGTGLTFYQDGEARFAPWDAIAGYDFVLKGNDETNSFGDWMWFSVLHARAPVCQIRMADGKTFSLTNRITQFPLLQCLLRRYAPDAIESRMVSNNKEALGGVAARWTGREEGKGERVYHRLTREQLVLLLITWAIGPLILWLPLRMSTPENNPSQATILLLLKIIPIFTLFGWGIGTLMVTLQTFLSRILIGAKGITVKEFPRQQFIPWNAIRQVEQEGCNVLLWLQDSTKVSFIPGRYAYGSEIRGLIEERMRPFQKRITQGDVPNGYQMPEETPVIQQVGVRGG